MGEGNKDLFGKIDALKEKRAPDALQEKEPADDDFPLLTEVISVGRGLTPPPETAISSSLSAEDIAFLVQAVEQRVAEVVARQQQRMAEVVREIIHEEIARMDVGPERKP